MTAFAEMKMQGLSAARLALSGREDEGQLVAFIHAWLEETVGVYKGNRSKIAVHPATAELADKFAVAGLAETADHLRRFEEETGPIHPGIWLFAVLLGKACAKVLMEALQLQRWEPARFWGHDCFGAWEAYRDEIFRLLSTDEGARNAAWTFSDGLVAEAAANPARHIALSGDRTSGVVKALQDFSAEPTIKESWEGPLGGHVYFEQAFFLRLLGEVDRPRGLGTLGRLPHPVFVEQVLDVDRTTTDPKALITASPAAFDNQRVFLHQGMVILACLRVAAARIRRIAWEGGEAPILYPAHQSASLEAAARSAEAAIEPVLDALFARADAESVTWAWLERLVFEVEHRGYWRLDRQQGNGMAVDIARILIMRIASRLGDRADWRDWVLGNQPLWQIDRLMAVLAVALWGKTKSDDVVGDCVRWALTECVVEFAGADSAISRSDGMVGYLGAAAILSNDDPGSFLWSLWHAIRPVREQGWRNAERNQIGKLVALWGLRAIELADDEARKNLEPVIKNLLTDAVQTEPDARHSGFWPPALHRFANNLHLPEASGTLDTPRRLADFLRPFARPDSLFLDLIVLLERKHGRDVLRSAVASIGINIGTMAREFLETENRRIQANAYSRKWLEKVRDLADAT